MNLVRHDEVCLGVLLLDAGEDEGDELGAHVLALRRAERGQLHLQRVFASVSVALHGVEVHLGVDEGQ